ncbi:hypothetical protein BGZ93_005861 [Podila epicladia]|nr:hypothetical protein BGZ93_005861 [Podila epicladia]
MTTVDDIRTQLQQLGLDSRGNKSTIKARLRKYLKKEQNKNPKNIAHSNDSDNDSNDDNRNEADISSLTAERLTGRRKKAISRAAEAEAEDTSGRSVTPTHIEKNSRYDYMLAFDVEATCESGMSFDFPNEVIEFPVVLLDGKTLEVETVDNAPTFVEVLSLFEEWLTKHGIILGEYSPTKGHGVDNKHFSPSKNSSKRRGSSRKGKGGNLQLTQPDFEDYFDLTQWLNLEGMLKFLGETFVGRQHSGICDARNVGRILKQLAQGFVDSGKEGSIFQPANALLVTTQWSEAKIAKFAGGCVLKANRHIDQTREVRMWSFEKLKRLEKLSLAQGAATAAGSSSGANVNDGEEQDEDDKAIDVQESEPLKASEP